MESARRNSTFTHIALIAALCGLSYANSFSVPFQFDDIFNLKDLPFSSDLSFFGQPWRVGGAQAHSLFVNRYIGYLSFALNLTLLGPGAVGYHAVNLAIHFSNALLVYALLRLALGDADVTLRAEPALFSALLFAAHPVQTQAVTYIVQRFASLTAMFYLASVVLYAVARRKDKWPRHALYALSFGSALLAMKTKEIALTIPLAVTLYEIAFPMGRPRERIARVAIFCALLPVIPVTHMLASTGGGILDVIDASARSITTMSRADYFLVQLRVVATYLRLLILPAGQNLDYAYEMQETIPGATALAALLHIIMISAATGLLLRAKCMWRVAGFGVLWFYLTLSVESSLIPLGDVIFEHRIYLPSAGMLGAMVCAAYAAVSRPQVRTALRASLVLVVLVFAAATVMRNEIWQSPVTLWQDTVSKSPDKLRPNMNLSYAYFEAGAYELSAKSYIRSIQIDPSNPKAYDGLGAACFKLGDMARAEENFRRAIELDPANEYAWFSLGSIAYIEKRYGDAKLAYESALKINPRDAQAAINLGRAYQRTGDVERASKAYQWARLISPSIALPEDAPIK